MSDPAVETALHLLRHPARPLLSIVNFFLHTGEFADPEAVLAELPDPLATESAAYDAPRQWLAPYLDEIRRFAAPPAGGEAPDLPVVLDEAGRPLPLLEAADALTAQRVLERELERINSLLCGARRCTLC